MAEADALQCAERRAPALARGDTGVEQAVGDVVERGVRLEQMELLEDEADAPRAQRGERALGCAGDVLARDAHDAAARSLERAHDVQQRRLARARRPDDRAQLALVNRQAHTAQRLHVAGIVLGDIAQLEHARRAHCGWSTVMPSCRPEPSAST